MYVVLINWNGGENDPFTVFNKALAGYLHSCGKLAKIIELTNPDWFKQMVDLKSQGIDYIISMQGIVTSQLPVQKGTSVLESLRIPLICIYGDHPCHHPFLHLMDSRYCAQVYCMREFAHYSNLHFRRRHSGAIYLESPILILDTPRKEGRSGDYFVFAKNTTAPELMEKKWRETLSGPALAFTLFVSDVMKNHIVKQPGVDFHAAIDDVIIRQKAQSFDPNTDPLTYHALHAQMDLYVRNLKSARVIEELQDVPLHIYGKGWDKQIAEDNKLHKYHEGKNMAESQILYYSNFGIVDVTPSTTGLHDRTERAIKNETPFLTSAQMPDFLPNMDRYGSLFYGFSSGSLRERCEAVMKNPEGHAVLSREFSHKYREKVNIQDFVWKLEMLARSMRQ